MSVWFSRRRVCGSFSLLLFFISSGFTWLSQRLEWKISRDRWNTYGIFPLFWRKESSWTIQVTTNTDIEWSDNEEDNDLQSHPRSRSPTGTTTKWVPTRNPQQKTQILRKSRKRTIVRLGMTSPDPVVRTDRQRLYGPKPPVPRWETPRLSRTPKTSLYSEDRVLQVPMSLEYDKIVGTQFCDTLSRAS